jgi:nucleoside-diphosphate-sugar epimerase
MRVFVTGANGWVGSAIISELLLAGHQVVGLVRSESKAESLRTAGGEPLLGSLSDLETLKSAASEADGVIHTAFGLDHSKITELAQEDSQAIQAFGDAYAGSERPIIITSGLFLAPAGEVFTEDMLLAPITPDFPRASEQTAFAVAQRGVRATWVRLPRSVHGLGETHGFIPMMASIARAKGVSAYVGDGQNLWPSVHRLDAARVFRLALEHGGQGGPFHAVADEGVAYRQIAEAIGEQLGVPTHSISPEEAVDHFGLLAMWVAGNGPASSAQTRARLGWIPEQPSLIEDISQPAYFQS